MSSNTKCQVCNRQASYNYKNVNKGIRCKKHIELGMVDVRHIKCLICNVKRPSFNYEGEKKATHCKDCSKEGMIDIIHKKCIVCKKKNPCFNYEGEKKATHCKDCSMDGMIDIKNFKCIVCNKKRPSFNYEGEKKATHCKDCSIDGMNDIFHKKCIVCKKKNPSFNYEGEKKATHCKDCSTDGMIDIISKKCIVCNKKKPCFNYEDEKKATHCKDCSTKSMIDLKNKKCIVCNIKRPNFNYAEQLFPTHCKDCSKKGMVDIQNKKCIVCNEIQVRYGYINQKKTHCARHKLSLMFMVTKPPCQECDDIAEYGIEEPSHCFCHKKENELCLLGQKCKNCLRENELCDKNKICLTYCKPSEIILSAKKIIKKKETMVLKYIDNNFITQLKPIDDRIVDNACVKRRPDRLYDCGSHFVIVEVDENGNNHGYTTNDCIYNKKTQEQRRMVQIHEALSLGLDEADGEVIGMIPIIFIRFNPDNFRVKGKIQKVNIQKRLEVLVKWLEYCTKYNLEKFDGNMINIKYLFYNDYDENYLDFDTIKL
jgi:hypothetical protein